MLFKRKYKNLNTIHVFKDALKHNLHLYQKITEGQAVCPVLKSNAYGHGLVPVAKALDKEGLAFMIVDSLYEAYELKKARIQTPILIIGCTHPDNFRGRKVPFHFAVFNKESAEAFVGTQTPIHIKIETGFSRMGFTLEDLKVNLPLLKKLNVEGVYAHFADADNPDSLKKTDEQVRRFEEAIKILNDAKIHPTWIHCANSAAAAKLVRAPFNMVRLGISLYGIPALEETDPSYSAIETLEPALELESMLVSVKKIKKGETVGYAGTFTAPQEMTVGVVPVGYYEAIPRSLSNKGFIEVNGKMCPILGRVCMNMTMIDLAGTNAKVFDPVVIYSHDPKKKNSVLAQSKTAGMIPYELLVHLSESVARRIQ